MLKRLLAIWLCTLAIAGCTSAPAAKPGERESAMQRVVRSGKIRCAYLTYSSYFRKDPNSGKLSGIFYDVMEEIGKNSGLKIEWVEEVGYENIFSGLDANRYDVFAGGLWANASRAKAGLFSQPLCYSAITTWTRPDNHKFDADLSSINSAVVKVATIDGAMEDIIARTDFPKAQRVSLPELSPFTQNLLNVTSRKADLTFAEPMVVTEFLKSNPKTLRQVAPDKPLRIFGNSLVVGRGEIELKEFLDVALFEIVNSGRADKILSSYESTQTTFYPLALPYRLPPQGR